MDPHMSMLHMSMKHGDVQNMPTTESDGIVIHHNSMPAMMMHHHSMVFSDSRSTDLLFRGLSSDDIGYSVQCIVCFIAGILAVVFKTMRNSMECELIKTESKYQRKSSRILCITFCNFCRAIAVCIILSWDYFLMLAVMTFNVGIFCSVVAGVATGFLLCGHLLVSSSPNNPENNLKRNDGLSTPRSEGTQPSLASERQLAIKLPYIPNDMGNDCCLNI